MAHRWWSTGQGPSYMLQSPCFLVQEPLPSLPGQGSKPKGPWFKVPEAEPGGRVAGSRDPSGPADVHGPSTMLTGAWVNSKGQCSDLKAPARSNKHWQAKLHRQAPPASRPPPPVSVSWTASSRSPSACPRSVHGRVCPEQQNNGYETSPPPMRPPPRPMRGRLPALGGGRSARPPRAPRKHLASAKKGPR